MNAAIYQDSNGSWAFKDGTHAGINIVPAGNFRLILNGTKVGFFSSINNMSLFAPEKFIEVTEIEKSVTPDDFYTSIATLKAALVGFFLKAPRGTGAVDSVFTRSGDVVAALNDYTKEQITGLTIADKPIFAGEVLTIADTVNEIGLEINQNNVTNNPIAEKILNTGSGDSLQINTDEFIVEKGGNVTIKGNSTIKGSQNVNVTTVNTATYILLITDYILHVTYTITGSITITIPTALIIDGLYFSVKDAGLNSSVFNITIVCEGGELIDGEANHIISDNSEARDFYSDGTNLFVK